MAASKTDKTEKPTTTSPVVWPVTYVGPFPDGVEEGENIVKPGESVDVDEQRAAHLTEGDAWELTNSGQGTPTPAPPGDEVSSLSPSEFDVHENPAVAVTTTVSGDLTVEPPTEEK